MPTMSAMTRQGKTIIESWTIALFRIKSDQKLKLSLLLFRFSNAVEYRRYRLSALSLS